MKLISLNTWAGQEYAQLMKFIGKQMSDTDIFCFQETTISKDGPPFSNGTRTNLLKDISEMLGEFRGDFATFAYGFDEKETVDFDIAYAQSIFVRKNIDILDVGSVVIDDGQETDKVGFNHISIMQHVLLENEGKQLTVCNVHGVPYPGSKLDTPDRLEQSRRIKAFVGKAKKPLILCGDFNLLPETESIKILEDGFENLITKHKITSTRGSLNPFHGTPEQQDFADYTFVSSGVKVEQFDVPNVTISDHLPMILKFSI